MSAKKAKSATCSTDRPARLGSSKLTRPTQPQAKADLETRRKAVVDRAARQAQSIKATILPSCLASALALDSRFDALGYLQYLRDFVEEAGNPTDPIHRAMLEQLAVAHLRVAQLHAHAGQAKSTEAIRVLSAAAARLLAEFRRLALAVRAYRQPAADRSPSMLKLKVG